MEKKVEEESGRRKWKKGVEGKDGEEGKGGKWK